MVLILKSTDPAAGLKARRWREKCRSKHQVSIIIYEDETDTHVELRELKQKEGSIDFSPMYEKYKVSTYSNAGMESNLTLSGHYSYAELEQDLQRALRRPRNPPKRFESPERTEDDIDSAEGDLAVAGFARMLEPGQMPMLILSVDEYEIVTEAVRAAAGQGVTNLFFLSAPQSLVDYPPEVRLEGWPPNSHTRLEGKKGKLRLGATIPQER